MKTLTKKQNIKTEQTEQTETKTKKAGIYLVKRPDGLIETVKTFTHALDEIRENPSKKVINNLTGAVSARMGVLLLLPKTGPKKLPHQELMEREIDIIGESVKESVSLRSYDKIRSDSNGVPFTLSFAVIVNTGDHEVACTMSGSIKVKNKATLSLPDPNQPELDLKMKEEDRLERIASEIERSSRDV